MTPFEDKFIRLADNQCWIWNGAVSDNGYGYVWYDGKSQGAHRVAWQLSNGPIPDGMLILHQCDNPICVNPSHLIVGTQAQNLADAAAKGHMMKKLSVMQKRQAVELHRLGLTFKRIGERFGVAGSSISYHVKRAA